MKQTTPLDGFLHLGIDVVKDTTASKGDRMLIATCPSCGKNKLFVMSTGQWHCKACHTETSNLYGFLEILVQRSLEATADAEYEELAADRGIPAVTLRRYQIGQSILTGKWLLPMRNQTGTMVNLHSWLNGEPVIATPSCALHPFGLHLLPQKKRPLWIAEGHWDFLVLDYCLRKVGLRQPEPASEGKGLGTAKKHAVDLLGWSASFKKEWIEKYCAGREVFLLFDNDAPNAQGLKPGEEAVKRFLREAAALPDDRRPSLIRTLKWPFENDGKRVKDVRDLWNSKKLPSYATG